MEEKRYPVSEEEEGIDMCGEPVVEAATPFMRSAKGITEVHDWIDDLDWGRYPVMGPATEEEAIAGIDQFEDELEKGLVKSVSSDKAWTQLYRKYPWLR
jgi:hypothetical protein